MKIGKYLRFHFRCLGKGKMPDEGLCFCLPDRSKLGLFYPDEGGMWTRRNSHYWAYDGTFKRFSEFRDQTKYTAMRQNVVLLMAAMNGEL